MNGQEINGATIAIKSDGNEMIRAAVLVFWTDKGLAWLEPGYNDPWNSMPAYRYERGDVKLAKENELGYLILRKTYSDGIPIRIRINLNMLPDIEKRIEPWRKDLARKGVTPQEEWARVVADLGIQDHIG